MLLAWPGCLEICCSCAQRWFPFHLQELLLLWNDPYQCKDQRSSWFCVTGHVEDTVCFHVGVATLILKVLNSTSPKMVENQWI